MALGQAPDGVLDGSGQVRVGTYEGWVGARWDPAVGALRRRLRQKSWHYVSIGGPRCLAAFAIIDLGWAASAFAYLFDREERRLLCDLSFLGVPGYSARVSPQAGAGAVSTWRGGGAELRLERPAGSDRWRVQASAKGFEVDATLATDAAPPTLCAIARPPGAFGNCTHKTVELAAIGSASAAGRRFSLDGYSGLQDHTCGVLARDTRWRWAAATSPGLSLNLVEGFNGPVENVLWLDGKLHPVGAARFEFDPGAPMRPWHVTTAGGEVDLEFRPEGSRGEDKNLLVAVSRYVQPIGTFHGTVRPGAGGAAVKVDGLLGVTENHEARW